MPAACLKLSVHLNKTGRLSACRCHHGSHVMFGKLTFRRSKGSDCLRAEGLKETALTAKTLN